MADELTQTPQATTSPLPPVEEKPEIKPVKFRIEKIDETTARKIDTAESVSIINIDFLRKQKEELEEEVEMKQQMLADINEVISEFDKQV